MQNKFKFFSLLLLSIFLFSCSDERIAPTITENNADNPWTIINSQNVGYFSKAIADELLVKGYKEHTKSEKLLVYRTRKITENNLFSADLSRANQIRLIISLRSGYMKIYPEIGEVSITEDGKEKFILSENISDLNWLQKRLNSIKREIETR